MSVDAIIKNSGLPQLENEYAIAEKLVFLIHRGVDWDVWGGARRVKYWDALTDRVKAATYAGNTLSHWWQHISSDLPSQPRSKEDRRDAATLILAPDERKVLRALREHSTTLVLRVRVINEIYRENLSVNASVGSDSPETSTTGSGFTPVFDENEEAAF